MKAFQRVKRSFTVSVESLLDRVENQEAVAAAAIRSVEQSTARVRLQRRRAERRVQELELELERVRQQAGVWRERAVALRQQHERALECVRRGCDAERTGNRIQEQLDAQRDIVERVARDEQELVSKLDDLKRRQTLLGSREARAEALGGACCGEDVELVFDRWEARVEERELRADSALEAPDALERELRANEERAELERELDRLLESEGAK
jgi:phage shock protein A